MGYVASWGGLMTQILIFHPESIPELVQTIFWQQAKIEAVHNCKYSNISVSKTATRKTGFCVTRHGNKVELSIIGLYQ